MLVLEICNAKKVNKGKNMIADLEIEYFPGENVSDCVMEAQRFNQHWIKPTVMITQSLYQQF